MPAVTRENCWYGNPHDYDGSISYDDPDVEVQYSRCRVCRQPLSRFVIDAEPGERARGWSRWQSVLYVIQELDP